MAKYLVPPIDTTGGGGGGGTDVSALSLEATQLLVLAQLELIKSATTQRTQSEFFATANNTASQSIASFITAAYGSAVVGNICNVTIINNDAGAVTITSPSGTVSLASGASMQMGNGSRKITGLGNITLGAGLTSYTIMWSELDAQHN